MTKEIAMIFLSLLGLIYFFRRNSFLITSNLRLYRKNLLDTALESLFILLLFLIIKNFLIVYLLIISSIKYYKDLNKEDKYKQFENMSYLKKKRITSWNPISIISNMFYTNDILDKNVKPLMIENEIKNPEYCNTKLIAC